MIELVEELENAGHLLSASLERYLNACFAIQDHTQQSDSLIGVPREVAERIVNVNSLTAPFEAKMNKAQSIIGQATKQFPALLPIHSLPSDSLVRIFHLVIGTYEKPWICPLQVTRDGLTIMLKYPHLLSHVCARWRRIMTNSPEFWTHIDLVPMRSQRDVFLARAEVYASRADKVPLNIHFCAGWPTSVPEDRDITGVLDFITAVAPRVRSLDLDTPLSSGGLGEQVLQCCFNNCIPQTFTELTLSDPHMKSIIPITNDSDYIKKLLLPVTVIRLNKLFLPWTHPIYQGLVELCLFDPLRETNIRITESELIGVLRSSPRLQILRFGIPIVDPLPEHSSMYPVRLEDLEILNLSSVEGERLGTILKLLAPGSKPLQFSFATPFSRDSLAATMHEIKLFLPRSKVARVHIPCISHPAHSTVQELLLLLPHLQILAIEQSRFFYPTNPGPRHTPSCVDAIYLSRCQVHLEWVQGMLNHYAVGMVVFWRCKVIDYNGRILSDHELKSKFSGLCQVVICDTREPSPIDYWKWPFPRSYD